MLARRYRVRLAAAACALVVLGGCSSGGSETTAAPAPPPPRPPAPTTTLPAAVPVHGLGAEAGFAGRAARVYDAYYGHCREFTPAALVWPEAVDSVEAAARSYAGPPREFQKPAYRGCLSGLHAGTGRITVEVKKQLAAEAAKEDGLPPVGG